MSFNPILCPPILQLDSDLLWSIFTLNADIFWEHNALTNTRLASQVCRSWRNLLLTTPSIWGKLMDLDALSEAGDDWAHEVLRRSGDALLWIKIDLSLAVPLKEFFLDILEKHWRRIQHLIVDVSSNDILATPDRWSAFYLPAPHLETFKVHIFPVKKVLPGPQAELSIAWSKPLFANDAPMLRVFHATQYKLDLPDLMNRLSSLRIGCPFTVQEALFALQKAPNLVYLSVDTLEGGMSDITQRLPRVHLPKLSYFGLNAIFKVCTTLLEHLEVPSNCHLKFFPCDFLDPADMWGDPEFLDSSFEVLSTSSERYFRSHPSSELHVTFHNSLGHFELKEDSHLAGLPNFQITIHSIRFPAALQNLILGRLALPSFSKVTELEMSLRNGFPKEGLMSFLSSFSSCRCITFSDEGTLHDFFQNSEQPEDSCQVMLRHVDTIKFRMSFLLFRDSSLIGKNGTLHQFLKYRRKHGCAIKMLDLRESDATLTPSLHYLEELHGLRVLWSDPRNKEVLEYECGSGFPEKLPLSFGTPSREKVQVFADRSWKYQVFF
ncbi:hypothetical protein CPB84DRAFT_1767091 [Gymnopilus junonius]|uniref:F-box domain-containing protein n=1 Tax=Gymnopilus junonius TaxID=109634 RepID=A0A9P5TSE7_GYMJU|nr:hypothetical protein CPB84DRAFT_1767091 [Gymnopilus junonius]